MQHLYRNTMCCVLHVANSISGLMLGLMLCMSKAHHERSQKHQKPLPTSWGLHPSPSSLRFCRGLVSEIKAPTADFDLPRKEDEHQNPWYHCYWCFGNPDVCVWKYIYVNNEHHTEYDITYLIYIYIYISYTNVYNTDTINHILRFPHQWLFNGQLCQNM